MCPEAGVRLREVVEGRGSGLRHIIAVRPGWRVHTGRVGALGEDRPLPVVTLYTFKHAHIHVFIYLYAYIYTYIYINTYIYIYIYI